MNRHVLTVFCDDIRQEIGGKLSYIGVYSGNMFVSEFPAVLPKLCLALSVITPVANPFRKLTLRVLKDEEILAEGSLDETELANFVEPTNDVAEDERKNRVQIFRSTFIFSPFKLDGPCTLRVRVETEEGEIRGVGLRIGLAPGGTDQPPPAV